MASDDIIAPRLWVPGVLFIRESGIVDIGRSAGWCLPGAQYIDDWKREEFFVFRGKHPGTPHQTSRPVGEHTRRWLDEVPLICVSGGPMPAEVYEISYHRVSGGGMVSAPSGATEGLGKYDWAFYDEDGPIDDLHAPDFIDRVLRKVSRGRLAESLVCAAVQASNVAGQSTPPWMSFEHPDTVESMWEQIFARAEGQRGLAKEVASCIRAANTDVLHVPGFGRLERVVWPALRDEGGDVWLAELAVWQVTAHDGWQPSIPAHVLEAADARARAGRERRERMERIFTVRNGLLVTVFGLGVLALWQPDVAGVLFAVGAAIGAAVLWKRNTDPAWIEARQRDAGRARMAGDLESCQREWVAVAAAWERAQRPRDAVHAYEQLSGIYRELGADSDSDASLKRAYDIAMEMPQSNRPGLIESNYAYHLLSRGDLDQAEVLARDQLARAPSRGAASRMDLLAKVLCAKGEHEEAQSVARELLESSKDTEDWAYALRAAASIWEKGEVWEEASDLWGRLLAHQAERCADNPAAMSGARLGRSRALIAVGRLDECEPLVLAAVAADEAQLKANPDREWQRRAMVMALEGLRSLRLAQGSAAAATEVQARIDQLTE